MNSKEIVMERKGKERKRKEKKSGLQNGATTLSPLLKVISRFHTIQTVSKI